MVRRTRSRVIGAKVALGVAAGALASGLTGVLAASPAGADTFTVSCTAGQLNNLQFVLDHAPAGSTINISGTCTGNFFIRVNSPLTLQGGILDGGNNGTVLTVNPGHTATLNSLIIQHGNTGGIGGGIFNESGTVTLNSSQVSNNQSVVDGGGIANFADVTAATLNVNSSSVTNNTTQGVEFGGGGIFNDGISTLATANVNSSSVTNNKSQDHGGGIAIVRDSIVNVNSSSVSHNTTSFDGGGAFNLTQLHLRSSLMFNNTAGDDGGGIFNAGTASLLASLVFFNTPDNCAGPSPVSGCSG